MGRYEFVKGLAIHKSATSVVLKAFDKLALDEYGVQFDKVLKEQQPNALNDASIDKECLRKVLKRVGFAAVDERFESFLSYGIRTRIGEFREKSALEFVRQLLVTIDKVQWRSSS
jgi:hypothetical protein